MAILIITHWDTDGLSSAATLNRIYGDSEVYIPEIGEFSLRPEELEGLNLANYDKVLFCDYAVPHENLVYLRDTMGDKVVILDHHLWTPVDGINVINPLIDGGDISSYPSTTWVIRTHYMLSLSIPIVLGVFGDHGSNVYRLKVWPEIEAYLDERGLDIDGLFEAVELIDSNYQVRDREEVYRVIDILSQTDDLDEILGNNAWRRNRRLFIDELESLERAAQEHIIDNRYVVFYFNSSFYLISPLARRFAWKRKIPILLVNRGFFEDRDQVFIRLPHDYRASLTELLIEFQNDGYVAGGRDDVLGIISPKEDTEYVIDRILKYMGWRRVY